MLPAINSVASARQSSVVAQIIMSSPALTSLLVLLAQVAGAEADQQPAGQLSQPALLVDTKYWIRNTEFGERDNWRDLIKPCTLLERISMIEQAVVSMGDSLDDLAHGGLESNVRDLTLAYNGILLLEEDSPGDQTDPLFIQYLNQTGDCREAAGEDQVFVFELESSRMSWFNQDNWASALNEREIGELAPDSHRIPCTEDAVVFGSRREAISPTVEANERAKSISFKVNFEPNRVDSSLDNVTVSQIRVSRLVINDQVYTQSDFEQLVNSEQYENILFQFNSSFGVLKPEAESTYEPQSLLVIDESSVQFTADSGLCLDEAGCLCGNEQAATMKLICSFHEPLKQEDHPCHDPIQSAGYCNDICATVMTITMDPTKFSELFVVSTLDKLISEERNSRYFGDSVFTGARRTHLNRYEITFRHVPSELGGGQDYESTLGREREFASLVLSHLTKDATKSFYGIKSVSMKSSVDWKGGNREEVFWVSFVLLAMVNFALLTYRDTCEAELDAQLVARIRNWLIENYGRMRTRGSADDDSTSEAGFIEYLVPDELERDDQDSQSKTDNMQLVELDKAVVEDLF